MLSSPSPQTVAREDALDLVAATLVSRSSRLARVLMSRGSRLLGRTEVGVLATLVDGPRRITELAETEGLAQPSVSKLVDRLEARGLVSRTRATDDGRAVLVSMSDNGLETFEAARSEIRSQLRQTLAVLDDDDLATLVKASEVMDRLVGTLQSGAGVQSGAGAALQNVGQA